MPDGEEKIRVVDAEGREETPPSPDDFDFSDIPILGQDKAGNREAFSFESFDKGSKPKGADPIASFTKMLKSESGESASEGTQEMTPEFLERQRQKWEKKAKEASAPKFAPWKIMALLALLLVVAIVAAVPFMLPSKKEAPAAPPPLLRPKPAAPQPAAPPPALPAQPEAPKAPVAPEAPPAAAQEAPKPPEDAVPPASQEEAPKAPPPPKPAISEEAEAAFDAFVKLFEPAKNKAVADDAKILSSLVSLQSEYPDELLLHQKLLDFLKEKGKDKLAKDAYTKWTVQKPDIFVPNYLYGTRFAGGQDSKPYLTRACAFSPGRSEAFVALARIFERERDWRKAADTYNACLLGSPDDDAVREALTAARIRAGEQDQAIAEMHEYLKSKGVSGSAMALRLVGVAQLLSDPELARKCVAAMGKDVSMFEKHKFYSIRQRMLYGGRIEEGEFGSFPSRELRPLYLLYLVSKGKSSKALLVPTPPDEFPDFWKVFLSWREDSPFWKANAEKLLERNAASSDRTIPIIVSVWLDRIKVEDARRMSAEVAIDSEPLYYFLLAEAYRKQGNSVAAKVLYSKALKENPNLYRDLVEFYMNRNADNSQ